MSSDDGRHGEVQKILKGKLFLSISSPALLCIIQGHNLIHLRPFQRFKDKNTMLIKPKICIQLIIACLLMLEIILCADLHGKSYILYSSITALPR